LRLQYAILCDDAEEAPLSTHNVTGLKSVVAATVAWQGEPSEPAPRVRVPLKLKLLASVLGGEPGSHNVWLVIRVPGEREPMMAGPRNFNWTDTPIHRFLINIDIKAPRSGLYEFQLLVDGEPLAVVPLPVIIDVVRDDEPAQGRNNVA
jgi:hypothetical protein